MECATAMAFAATDWAVKVSEAEIVRRALVAFSF
jgi:hypothetical protein